MHYEYREITAAQVTAVLAGANAALARKADWTQGIDARDAAGGVVNPWNADAVCFCVGGAIWHAAAQFTGGEIAQEWHDLVNAAERRLMDQIPMHPNVPEYSRERYQQWNDSGSRKFTDIKRALAAAIAAEPIAA